MGASLKEIRAVICPACHAGAGAPCRWAQHDVTTGPKEVSHHTVRIEAAVQARRARGAAVTGERTALQRAVDMGMHRGINRRRRDLGRSGFGTVHQDIYGRLLQEMLNEGVIDADDVRKMVELAIVELVRELYRAQRSDISNLRHHIEELNRRVDSLALHQLLESWPDHAEENLPELVELEQLVTEAMEYDRWA